MGFMSPGFARYFKDLHDGGSVFYPNGPAGRGYQVPDWRVRDRIERRLRFLHFLNIALATSVTQAVMHAPGGWWWLAGILVVPAIDPWLLRSAAEGLDESSEPYTRAESAQRQLEEQSWSTLVALLVVSAVFIVGGA